MKKELQDHIMLHHPLLYGDRDKSMRNTAICWGLSSGDGWADLIYNLSSKLEKLICEYIEQNPDLPCEHCGELKDKHNTNGTYQAFNYVPFRLGKSFNSCLVPERHSYKSYFKYLKDKLKLFKHRFQFKINRMFILMHKHLKFGKYVYFKCNKYSMCYPKARQCKEKFGGLRMYMTFGTDEIYDLINEAERKSYTICEDCGESGQERDGGWIRVLCDMCDADRAYKQKAGIK